MDNLTHTLFALTLARTRLGRAGRGTTATILLASNAPDIDIVAAARGSVSYLEWHRGPTHGPLGIVGLGVIAAGLVWLGRRELDKRRPPGASRPAASFQTLAAIAITAVLLHVAMDVPTSYGTRLLSPFDWRWFAFDWLPIIDVPLLAILSIGVALAELSKASRGRFAAIALMLMASDYGLRAAAHHQAMGLAPALFGPRLPRPCDTRAGGWIESWPKTVVTTTPAGAPCLAEIAAVPSFGSPFRWNVIARLSNAYELHELDVLDAWRHPADARDAFWFRAIRYPDQWRAETITAARTRTGRVFLGFSRYPAARTYVDPTGTASVRWNDMRFAVGVPEWDVLRPPNLFNVVVRLAPDGSVKQERFGP